nr:MAG TPA: Na+/H+ antiporter-like protein domain, cda, CpaA, TRANSPORT [Caudoviricetes sp.]
MNYLVNREGKVISTIPNSCGDIPEHIDTREEYGIPLTLSGTGVTVYGEYIANKHCFKVKKVIDQPPDANIQAGDELLVEMSEEERKAFEKRLSETFVGLFFGM